MPKPLAKIAFLVIEVALLPVTLVGLIWLLITLSRLRRRTGVSATAFLPLVFRWLLHATGARPDDAAQRLLRSFPGVPFLAFQLAGGPTLLAIRLTGFTLSNLQYPAPQPPTTSTYMAQRTAFHDSALHDQPASIQQIVILGAGWDVRAYNLPASSSVPVYEVDAAATQQLKRTAVQHAGLNTAPITYVAADFNRESWLAALKRSGFDPAVPTFVLWEGVTPFLEPAAIHATLEIIGRQLAGGSAISFDYVSQEGLKPRSLASHLATLIRGSANEGWGFCIATNPPARDHVARLVGEHGLTLTRHECYGQEKVHNLPIGGLALAVKNATIV